MIVRVEGKHVDHLTTNNWYDSFVGLIIVYFEVKQWRFVKNTVFLIIRFEDAAVAAAVAAVQSVMKSCKRVVTKKSSEYLLVVSVHM